MPHEYRIRFLPADITIPAEAGENLLETAMKAGVHVNASCGGRGVCGKCRVRIASGEVGSEPHSLISDADQAVGFRLACASTITADAVVEVPLESQVDRSNLRRSAILSDVDAEADSAVFSRYGLEPLVGKIHVKLPPPDLKDNISDAARLVRELSGAGCTEPVLSAAVLKSLGTPLRDAGWDVTVNVESKGTTPEVIFIAGGDRKDAHFAIAVDVGTTTIAAQLVSCGDGRIRAAVSDYNGQISYGEDVISRIMYTRKRRGLKKLQEVLLATITGLTTELLVETKIDPADIAHIVVAGNTTMMHLLYGIEPKHLMLAPYTPLTTSFEPVAAVSVGMKVNDHAQLYAVPGVASYVGGDIVSGVTVSGMTERPDVSLFMDIGTNGELVLGNDQWLLCASCSAGPAFEGGGIQFGMRAAPGAIEKVRIDPATLEPMIITVGRTKPLGICGSGLIDLVAELFLAGAIDRNGRFGLNGRGKRLRDGAVGREYVLCFASETKIERDIVLTEIDLDNIMRTKAAVYAGCTVLLENGGLAFGDLETVIIAGGFGHSLDVERAIAIGLLPELPARRFRFMGNASLGGARMACLSRGFYERTRSVARSMTNIELSNNTQFMDEFMAAMFLPHTSDRAFPEVMKALEGKDRS